ncbi:hypothetical protein L226DRAFT_552389 [Lentinus tigrinus ALCF2SS1-7]|uniref:Ferritin-like domain-containing protein n=1 Tax=Lentinus tigrinus ALCF2SS1-6 TaxID=1328759 RepID=A0A5C2SBI3_9APHY|nr:hypothetical protein L227DRAFT_653304 [Lentinus tigrinus ALCF2SS1-6]RPD75884.1 hypothetical protein L226DRAFT_552389 [Lentinus tigrinus ALCF2SS1-7]
MFKKTFLLAFAAIAGTSVRAAPSSSRILTTDIDVLQYALTIEHIANAYYKGALAEFDDKVFADAGYSHDVRNRFVEIGSHEAAHVKLLSDILGSKATQPCIYEFLFTDVVSFVVLAGVLENLADSAYVGAIHLIQNPDYVTTAATILSVQARHATWVPSDPERSNPFNGAFDEPLPASSVIAQLMQFIKECPSPFNSTLPFDVRPFPTLTLSDDSPAAGDSIIAHFAAADGASDAGRKPAYVAWLGESKVEYSVLGPGGETIVPHGLKGVVYALAVSSENGKPSTANMLSGLAPAHIL